MAQRGRTKLSYNLLLNAYMNQLFGMNIFSDFQSILSDIREGFDEEGHSYCFHVLSNLQNLKIPVEKLEEYDYNIGNYVQKLNQKRDNPIKLKYFQYLSVLFTELFLDNYFSNPIGFLNELNAFVSSIEGNTFFFSKQDLKKLAYWMATGSGKTLLVHINFFQFQKYNHGLNKMNLDNMLLITPSETLSDQHIKEMQLSNVPCAYFHDIHQGYFSSTMENNIVKVLDIHKFTENKTGSGVTIDIEEFGNRNLVFVDEGHKGTGGEKWRSFREFVAKEGFTFEYSATFGQAVSSATKKTDQTSLIEEYGKCILFDYSYQYFYNDGYGKDYRILNLKQSVYSEAWDILLLANALTFYEQKLLFEELGNIPNEYNIKQPLWIFVGSKVTGEKSNSDILSVCQFLNKLLTNKKWTVKTIECILSGVSGLLDNQDRDLFSPQYPEQKLQYLRDKGLSGKEIYTDLLNRVFHVSGPAPLQLVNLKNIEGEIGLRAGISGMFFGVINIGDVNKFLNIAEKKGGFPLFRHELAHSLFYEIEEIHSQVNVLIGAKKFIEGWNSWRVSNMGLLNIGKKEGSQIIQLFGRGVRLRGKDFALKRSSVIETNPPRYLRILETLNIFGIQANYMEQFRDYLQDEGIDHETRLGIRLDIQINNDYVNKNLVIPKFNISRFSGLELFEITGDEDITVTLDLNPQIETVTSLDKEGIGATAGNPQRIIKEHYLPLLNWNSIFFQLLNYRKERGWYNIVFSKDTLHKIINRDCYSLYCPEHLVNPANFKDITLLEDIVVAILKKYIRRVYNQRRHIWSQKNVEIARLTPEHENLVFEKFILKVKESERFVLAEVKDIVERKINDMYNKEFKGSYLSNVYFDRHIYQPLLVESNDVEMSPSGLNLGEQQFVDDLKHYFKNNQSMFEDTEVYLLRNLPKRGLGFYGDIGFYPDFIIWIKFPKRQHLIFVDPHGLVRSRGFDDEKILWTKHIKEIEQAIRQKYNDEDIYLDLYIVSVSPYNTIRSIFANKPKNILEENHILFQQDKDYISKIFGVIKNQ